MNKPNNTYTENIHARMEIDVEAESNSLLDVDPVTIPASHAIFAKAVAEIADTHGMSKFTMTYNPKWNSGNDADRRISGEMRINYTNVDRRGRPCRNLSIDCDASLSLSIERNEESYS